MIAPTPPEERPRPRDIIPALIVLGVLNLGIPLLAELATGGLR